MSTQKGFSLLIVVGVVAVIAGAVFFIALQNRTTPEAVVQQAKDAATEKAMEAKDAAMEKGTAFAVEGAEKAKDAAMERADDAVDKAVAEGKVRVGDAMQDAGNKMVDEARNAVDGTNSGAGTFEKYSAEKIAANDGAVLFFHAQWCPTCKALEKDLIAHATDIPAGVTILQTDYDTELDLRKKYKVTLQHTMVQVDATGDAVKTWRGGNTLASVVKNIQ